MSRERKNNLGVQRLFLFPFIHFLNSFTCPGKPCIALRIVYTCRDGMWFYVLKETKYGSILLTYFKTISAGSQLKKIYFN